MAKLTCIAVDVEQSLYMAIVNHVGHAVGADEEDIIDEKVAGDFLHVDKCCGASCTDTVGDGICMTLFTIKGGKAVVGAQLLQRSVAETIDTAVTTVYPIDSSLIEKQSDERRTHITVGIIVLAFRVDYVVYTVEPFDNGFVEFFVGKFLWHVAEEEVKA